MIDGSSVEPYLLDEENQAERLAGRVRLGALAVLLVLQLVLLATGSEQFLVVAVSLVAIVIASVFGLAMNVLLRRGYRPYLSYLSITHDVVILSIVTLGSAFVLGRPEVYAQATKSPFSLVYFLVIALAGLRQAPRMAVFAGVVSAACYIALAVPVGLATPALLAINPTLDFTGPYVSPFRVGTVAVLILTAGLLAAVTAGRARSLVRRAVGERDQAMREQQRRQSLLVAFERYFPEKEALQLISEGRELERSGERREVTVLTTDIRGFTSLSENLEPSQVVDLLNLFFEAMVEIIFQYEGTLISFVGDALWAVFGLPSERPDDAERAVKAALAMRERLKEMNADGSLASVGGLRIGTAIHSGPVLAGSIGSVRRVEYTVIGDTVNTASRLEEANKVLGTDLLLTEATARRLPTREGLIDKGSIDLRGKVASLAVFSI